MTAPDPLTQILDAMPSARVSGSGWLANCPAHGDRNASLSIGTGSDGRVLLHCHAGCEPADICDALGITLSDLFPHNGNGRPKRVETPKPSFPTVDAAIASYTRPGRPPAGRWDYHDIDGNHVETVLRFDKSDGTKDMLPISLEGNRWYRRHPAAPRPLYHLPELADAETVVIVEGEKCADAARSLGLTATTSSGGSQSARRADWTPLAGKPCIILPDNDEPGKKYAREVADILRKLSPPADVKIIQLEGLPQKGDIVDWIEQHGDAAEPETLRDRVLRAPECADDETFKITALSAAELDDGDFTLTYLVEDVLVAGQPAICAAPKKSLKTNTMIDLTLSIASGASFLGEFYVPQQKRVALLSGESGKATIQETARRVARSKPLMHLRDYNNAFFGFDLPNFADDRAMKALREFIRKFAIDVLIVDPAYLCLSLGDDAGNLFKVGQILRPFTRLAEDEQITPVIVHHFIKAAAVTETTPEMESIAWAGFQEWMRQWLLMSRRSRYDPDNPGHHELWFAAGGSAGHSVAKALDIEEGSPHDTNGRKWNVNVKSIGEAIGTSVDHREQIKEQRNTAKNERQREKDVVAVNRTLAANPEGLTFTTLRTRSGVAHARLQTLLIDMAEEKTVRKCKIVGANKVAYDGFQLEPVQPVQPVQKTGCTDSDAPGGESVQLSGFPIERETDTGSLSLCVEAVKLPLDDSPDTMREALAARPEGILWSELREATGLDDEQLTQATEALKCQGVIQECAVQRGGSQYDGLRLVGDGGEVDNPLVCPVTTTPAGKRRTRRKKEDRDR